VVFKGSNSKGSEIDMNQAIAEKFCRDSMDLLDFRMRQNGKRNKCGFPGTIAHARKIFEICYELNKLGKTFYTEAVFKNKSRADIFVLDERVAIEVLESEEQASINDKRERYPCRIVQIRTNEEWKEELIY
jgi:hypothetical protein